MERGEVERWAADWVGSWDAHDLDRVLDHCSDDGELSSPPVPVVTGGPGPLRGRSELAAHWAEGLR